jgi:hypothetical protein
MVDDILNEQHSDFRALCTAIGFVVVNWAIIEQQIDNWVNVTFLNCGGKALRKKHDIPRAFQMKVIYLKDCFKKLESLGRVSEEGLALLGRVSKLSKQRNDLVHSARMALEPVDGAFHFRKVEYKIDNHAVSDFTFDPDAFSKLETSLEAVLTEQIAFSQKLADEFIVI